MSKSTGCGADAEARRPCPGMTLQRARFIDPFTRIRRLRSIVEERIAENVAFAIGIDGLRAIPPLARLVRTKG